MTQAVFWCYPWDLMDEGCEAAAARLAGEIGVDAICVAAVTTAVAELRGRNIDGPRVFRTAPGIHFQPESKYYGTTGLRPVLASWLKSRDPLRQIVKAAQKERLSVRARIECCESETLIARFPHIACVGLYGDAHPRRMCPHNAAVREYLGALVENITAEYAFQALELAQLGFGGASAISDLLFGAAASDADRAILSACFCSACRQKAGAKGIDVAAVLSAGRVRLDEMFAGTGTTSAPIEVDPLLASYFEMQSRELGSLAAHLRTRTNLPIWLQADAIAETPALGDPCDGIICDPPAGKDVFDSTPADRRGVRLSCCPPHVSDGPSLVARVHEFWQRGCAHIGFWHYGLASEASLEWIRQALRYSRRDTSRPD